ncbi:MAG: hypothetical protein N2109_07065 [Fimbriimonadales bacterium]|nr:hypothetical protein [Fimbriimonadales bacterium]
MPRQYRVLSQEEMDDIVVEFFAAQERDMFCHELNKQRYEEMLKVLPEGEYRQRVARLLAETNERMAEVEAIIAKTEPQLPPTARVQAAAQRIKAKSAKAGS